MSDYSSLLKGWDGLCVICGEPFENPNSITREHLIPKSQVKFPQTKEGIMESKRNIAPSHYACNSVRGDLPLIEAIRLVEMIRIQLGDNFHSWVHRSVPNRNAETVRL